MYSAPAQSNWKLQENWGGRSGVEPCVPARSARSVLGMMKLRLVGATKGHALLKKKADALTMRFRYVQRQG